MKEDTDKFLLFIAILSLLFVLGDIFLWVNISNQYSDTATFREEYLDVYPTQIRSMKGLCFMPLILLFIASLVFIRSVKSNLLKIVLATVFAVLAIVIIWKMFALI